jgi:hypothetical protein
VDQEGTGPHTALWTFDAEQEPGIVDESARTITASHTFTTPGVYTVRLAVTNNRGDVGTTSQNAFGDIIIVIYDPSGGFVTGAGWFDSPAGAYRADPALSGRATFGFVSRYRQGATNPSGETEFSFRAGDLELHSLWYDWLVVSGARAQYRGTGVLRGGQSVDFALTVTDGYLLGGDHRDRFRIKITDWGSHEIIYDNQYGASDGSDPSTVIGGGSVVVHRANGAAPASSSEEMPPEVTAFALAPASPNPFSSSIQLEKSDVELAVFDLQGRLVAELATGVFPPGRYQHRWDGYGTGGQRLGPGVYLVHLLARPGAGHAPYRAVHKIVRTR